MLLSKILGEFSLIYRAALRTIYIYVNAWVPFYSFWVNLYESQLLLCSDEEEAGDLFLKLQCENKS